MVKNGNKGDIGGPIRFNVNLPPLKRNGAQGCTHGFFLGEPGVLPHPAKILSIPPSTQVCPLFGPRLVPPPPAEDRPRKFEKSKYIFVSNLTTFKLKSTLKSCISKMA